MLSEVQMTLAASSLIKLPEDPTIPPEGPIRLSEDPTTPSEGPIRPSEDLTSPLDSRGPYQALRGPY